MKFVGSFSHIVTTAFRWACPTHKQPFVISQKPKRVLGNVLHVILNSSSRHSSAPATPGFMSCAVLYNAGKGKPWCDKWEGVVWATNEWLRTHHTIWALMICARICRNAISQVHQCCRFIMWLGLVGSVVHRTTMDRIRTMRVYSER